ncbi:winged helix-turn-helix domain-containing protein [Paenibacillus lignilyticus]
MDTKAAEQNNAGQVRVFDDGQPHTMDSILEQPAVALNLTDSDRSELVICGRPFIYINRIISARTYLLRAACVAYDTNKQLVITETSREWLKTNSPIDQNFPCAYS